MTQPTPVTPIDAAPDRVADHLEGARVEVDDDLRRRLGEVCAVVDDDESRAEAGRDWWPVAIGWAVDGQVPSRPAVVARPTDTAQVAGGARPVPPRSGCR